MKYLFDTHTLIWYLNDYEKIPAEIQNIIHLDENEVYISIVSIWEIAIKFNINKLDLPYSIKEIIAILKAKHFKILSIRIKYLILYRNLSLIHRDPFDRLIVSTAISDDLILLTSDSENQLYPVNWIWN